MNKFLTIVSYPQKEDGEFVTAKKDYKIISLENIYRICFLYDSKGYTLLIEFEDDQYEYPLLDAISDREIQDIVIQLTDFLDDDTRTTKRLDLTQYQR